MIKDAQSSKTHQTSELDSLCITEPTTRFPSRAEYLHQLPYAPPSSRTRRCKDVSAVTFAAMTKAAASGCDGPILINDAPPQLPTGTEAVKRVGSVDCIRIYIY